MPRMQQQISRWYKRAPSVPRPLAATKVIPFALGPTPAPTPPAPTGWWEGASSLEKGAIVGGAALVVLLVWLSLRKRRRGRRR